MSLKEKLAEDLKSSMKNKDTVRKNTVQLVRTAILQVEKDNKVTLDDEDILEVIAKQLKLLSGEGIQHGIKRLITWT